MKTIFTNDLPRNLAVAVLVDYMCWLTLGIIIGALVF